MKDVVASAAAAAAAAAAADDDDDDDDDTQCRIATAQTQLVQPPQAPRVGLRIF